jgi:hypothetical protein
MRLPLDGASRADEWSGRREETYRPHVMRTGRLDIKRCLALRASGLSWRDWATASAKLCLRNCTSIYCDRLGAHGSASRPCLTAVLRVAGRSTREGVDGGQVRGGNMLCRWTNLVSYALRIRGLRVSSVPETRSGSGPSKSCRAGPCCRYLQAGTKLPLHCCACTYVQ